MTLNNFLCLLLCDCDFSSCICFVVCIDSSRGCVGRQEGLLDKPCFMHEGQGWGPLGGCVSGHTQQPDQRTPQLLGRDAQSSCRHWSSFSFVLQHSCAISFFLCPQCSFHSYVHGPYKQLCACAYMFVRIFIWECIPKQWAALITSVTLNSLRCSSEGFLTISLYPTFLHQQWHSLQGFNYSGTVLYTLPISATSSASQQATTGNIADCFCQHLLWY